MSTPSSPLFTLLHHPASACPCVHALHVQLSWHPHALRLRYTLVGALACLRVPPPSPSPTACDGLWQHTCFEAFVGNADSAAYDEFNFSPSGDWAVYAFAAERVRATEPRPAPRPTPRIGCQTGSDTLHLSADVPLAALPARAGAHVPIGLSAVIESTDGHLSYWALAHPREVPDFHHRAGWTARLS